MSVAHVPGKAARTKTAAVLIGLSVAALALLVAAIGWALLGDATGIWVDGCPDVVDAYETSHAAFLGWWRPVFLFVLPAAWLVLAAYAGLWAGRTRARGRH